MSCVSCDNLSHILFFWLIANTRLLLWRAVIWTLQPFCGMKPSYYQIHFVDMLIIAQREKTMELNPLKPLDQWLMIFQSHWLVYSEGSKWYPEMLISVSHTPINHLWINLGVIVHHTQERRHTLNNIECGWEKEAAYSKSVIQNIPFWSRTGAPKALQFQEHIYFLPIQRNWKSAAAPQCNALQKFRGILMRCCFFLELFGEL